MKKTDIQKIRRILKELKRCEEQHIIFNLGHKTITLADIDEALALLPCETCGGTSHSKALVVDDLSGGIVDTDIPCPDCQPSAEKTCQKEGNCTRYMDGTCEDCPDYK